MCSVPGQLAENLREASRQSGEHRRLAAELVTIEADLLRVQQLAERWGREVGTFADQLRELSGFRLIAFLRGLFGGARVERRDVERQLRDAKDAYGDADAQISNLQEQRQQIVLAQSDVAGAPGSYAAALAAKESWLREQGDAFAGPLEESAALLTAAGTEKKTLDSLVFLGRQAEGELLIAKQAMQEARAARGAHFAGGVVITGAASHRKFDEGKRHMDRAAEHLRGMSEEMAQQSEVLHKIELSTGTKIADVLFDSLSVDWFLQRRIVSASEDLTDTIDCVRRAVWATEKQRKLVIEQLAKIQDERARWIEQAG
jgi:hypothetical protein